MVFDGERIRRPPVADERLIDLQERNRQLLKIAQGRKPAEIVQACF